MKRTTIILTFISLLFFGCRTEKEEIPTISNTNNPNPNPNPTEPSLENTFGYGVLNKIKGIWDGPVTSTTPLGNYPEWIVDFRPISENQVSAKNELDTLNDIHMSFFIAKYNNEYKVAFRNGGAFAGNKRVSYFLADSVSETSGKSFYRFAEIIKGKSRAYTEVIFSNDSVYIKSYTNKYNTQTSATPHMVWSAKLQDASSCQPAVTNFTFPKKTLTKDFSTTFTGQTEAIYFSLAGDPYPEADQPYLGKANISYSFASGFTPNASKKVLLMITTQPLISGFSVNTGNLKYRSRYVILDAGNNSFTFNYMHPGTYYLYALYDNNGDGAFTSGDWTSTTNTTFTLPAAGNVSSSTQINFTIP